MSEKPSKTESFDPKTLKISQEATDEFYAQGGERGSSPMKIAYDAKGRKVLLKTFTFFKPDDQSNEEASISLEAFREAMNGLNFEEELARYKDLIFSEERGYRLAQLLEVPMAETKYTELNGVPFIAYQFLDGAIDRHVGIKLEYEADEARRTEQETTVALSGLLKTWVRAGDGGQFLQNAAGDIFLSDLSVYYVTETSSDELIQQLRSSDDLPRQAKTLEHALNGMRTEKFKRVLKKLRGLNEMDILRLISRDVKKPTEDEKQLAASLKQRLGIILPFFEVLSSSNDALEKLSRILIK